MSKHCKKALPKNINCRIMFLNLRCYIKVLVLLPTQTHNLARTTALKTFFSKALYTHDSDLHDFQKSPSTSFAAFTNFGNNCLERGVKQLFRTWRAERMANKCIWTILTQWGLYLWSNSHWHREVRLWCSLHKNFTLSPVWSPNPSF